MKGKASTSVQCAPVRRARKRGGDQLTQESAETQTLEGGLVPSDLFDAVNSGRISVGIDAVNEHHFVPWHLGPELFHERVVPTPSTEISVQTEDVDASNRYSTIETQTMACGQELLSLFDSDDGNDLFLELNDIETQTNWSGGHVTAQTTDASTCIDEFFNDFNF